MVAVGDVSIDSAFSLGQQDDPRVEVVVLAVGVVVSLGGVEHLVPHANHGRALREKQSRHEVPGLCSRGKKKSEQRDGGVCGRGASSVEEFRVAGKKKFFRCRRCGCRDPRITQDDKIEKRNPDLVSTNLVEYY